MRSGGGGGQYGLPDAVNHNGHGQIRPDVVQSGHRGRSQRTDRPGDRCDGRLYGHRHRPYDAAIPYAEPFERAGDVESARAVRQGALLAAVARNARKHAKSLPVARRRNRPSDRTKYGRRGHDSDGSAIPLESRYFDRRNLPRRVDAHRPDACSGRSRRRSRFARAERPTGRTRFRSRTHENRHSGPARRPFDRLQPTRRATRRRNTR